MMYIRLQEENVANLHRLSHTWLQQVYVSVNYHFYSDIKNN